eukprot:TRINITY_DN10402_c0_g4_i1.p1 TRINITY_DN10402_c0_g4~~TRINITY_DN10402_c0_g4_i1.p1  ORF type:complete len:790 (+),score=113.63 TRINITY_DN10402_c0_g4_i1:78-2447(+)
MTTQRKNADELFAKAAESVFSLGREKTYLCCTLGGGDCSRRISSEFSDLGHITACTLDAAAAAESLQTAGEDRGSRTMLPSLDALYASNKSIAGAFIDLGASQSSCQNIEDLHLRCRSEDIALDLRINPGEGVGASEWLQAATRAQLSQALDMYASLHDPLISDRIAEAILHRQCLAGPYTSVRQLVELVDELKKDFEEEHPHFSATRILRALRVVVNKDSEILEKVLEHTFSCLEHNGSCAVISFNPWELETIRAFLHNHEEPHAQMTSISRERLTNLYPLLGSNKDYRVQRSCRPIRPTVTEEGEHLSEESFARTGMLHILQKLPREFQLPADAPTVECSRQADWVHSAPAAPSFMGARLASVDSPAPLSSKIAPVTEFDNENDRIESEDVLELDPSVLAELEELKENMLARKKKLNAEGLSLSQQKQDPQIVMWNKRMRFLHGMRPTQLKKVEKRCRERCHIPVLLAEAVEHLMALGPNDLYVDCTFGRGGHSKFILSKLSEGGRLKAFDVDPLAVQVGQEIAQSDGRFEIIHRPFGDLSAAILEDIGGILLDLGVSSPQLDDNSRGFSVKCRKDGLLDLRMNQDVGLPASEWLQNVTSGQLAWVIRSTCYRLESPLPDRIAEMMLQRQRVDGPFKTTSQLVTCLDEFAIQLQHEHPNLNLAHIVFCAIRVFLNQEMEQFEHVLDAAFQRLKMFGRCSIICFNRWEMAAVRRFLRRHEEPSAQLRASLPSDRLAELFPLLTSDKDFAIRRAVQPLGPTAEELARNPRAKSQLHVLEKIPRSSAAVA